MLRFAIVGTNTITERFIAATRESKAMQLAAVYSRSEEHAREFANRHQVTAYYSSLSALAEAKEIDAVYIASPNSLHGQQSMLFLNHGKHVICEKPLASNLAETEAMIACARKNKRVLFEAYKTAYLPNFYKLKMILPELGRLRKALFQYCQYSSRYQRYLNGENPNTFNPEFSNGSIMDIGYYCIACAVALWGEPCSVQASATLLPSGVDGHGSVILNYAGFDVTCLHSKVSNSHLLNEVQGEEGSITIEAISRFERLMQISHGGAALDISQPQADNRMCYEIEVFVDLVTRQQVEHPGLENSRITARVIDEIRRQTGVRFPADVI